MPYGFQPMVKVIDDRVYPTTYYFTNSVNQTNENYASANGDFWKGLLSSGIKTVQQQHLNKTEYSEAEIQQVYKESGTKKTFAEWFNSPEGKDTLNDVLNLTTSILDKDKNTTTPLPAKKEEEEKPETTILWMHPLTFGVVAIVGLVSAIILIPMFKKKKTKILP